MILLFLIFHFKKGAKNVIIVAIKSYSDIAFSNQFLAPAFLKSVISLNIPIL